VLLKQGEDTHLVMLTDAGLIGLSTQSGAPLWKFPIKLAWGSAMTPAIISDQVIISDKDLGLVSVRVGRQGNEWVAKQVWEKREFFAYMSSPVVKDGMVYGLSHRNRGQYFCVDLQTGQMLWQSEGRQGEMAVVRVGNNEFFVQTEDGELIVARKSREKFDIVRRYQIAESATWAEPVLFEGQVLIKDANSLTLWSVS
jgi:outer membrane protein assembly factor BamB